MDNIKVAAYTDLQLQIDALKKEKKEKEDKLKNQFSEIATEANPIKIVKEYVGAILEDKDLKLNISKIGINLSTNFLIEKLLGRNRSIKGYLSSMLVEKFSTSIINILITKHQTNTNKKIKNENV
jgi:hypothetical protein